ncbi:MAG: hypothetical protein K5829_14045 [Treponema sp.]|nr:hypothetical protein [Treponema sp.]
MKKSNVFLISILVLLGLTSCAEMISQKNGKAYVSFSTVELSRDAVSTIKESSVAWDDIVQIELTASLQDSEEAVIKKSWTAIESLTAVEVMEASDAIELNVGSYDFLLNLYANTNLTELHLTQCVELKAVELVEGENTVTFEPEWASEGDLSITFEWETQSSVVGNNAIEIIKAGLFTLDGIETEECPMQSLEITSGEELSSAQLTCEDLPAGRYRLKYRPYNKDEEALRPYMSSIVYINGFETVNTITIDTEHLNYIYDIPYVFEIKTETITVNDVEYSLEVEENDTDRTITFTAPEGFASYQWYVADEEKTSEDTSAANVITLSKLQDFELGVNQVYCLVTDDAENVNQIEAYVSVGKELTANYNIVYYQQEVDQTYTKAATEELSIVYLDTVEEEELNTLITESIEKTVSAYVVPEGFEYSKQETDSTSNTVSVYYDRITVKYVVYSIEGEAFYTESGLYGDSALSDFAAPEKEDYHLTGWTINCYESTDSTEVVKTEELTDADLTISDYVNFQPYALVTFTAVWTPVDPASVSFEITLQESASDSVSETINLTFDSETNTFTAKEGFATYRWLLDGDIVSAATTNSYEVSSELDEGYHTISVEVTDENDELYSSSLTFELVK